jgi:hypothetical protein
VHATIQRITPTAETTNDLDDAPAAPEPSTAEIRTWARANGITVPNRGKLRPEIWNAWRTAHQR